MTMTHSVAPFQLKCNALHLQTRLSVQAIYGYSKHNTGCNALFICLDFPGKTQTTEEVIHFRDANWVCLVVLNFSAGVGDFTGKNGNI